MTSNMPSRHSGAKRSTLMAIVSVMAFLLALTMGINHAGAVGEENDGENYPPSTSTTVEVIPDGGGDPTPGSVVEIIADGFQPGTEVEFFVEIDGQQVLIGTAIADENGVAVLDWTIPAGFETGEYVIEIEGIDEETGLPRTTTAAITIVAGGDLPYTGSNSTNLVRIGFVLVLAGGLSVVAVRRRSARAAS